MTSQLQRILVVEDDPDIQVVAQLSLEAVGGYTTRICSGGREALQIVGEFAPDLVLLDVMMPDMDGPTVLRHLREREAKREATREAERDATRIAARAVPVIFMTARAQASEIASYLALGALGVVAKPFDPMELPAILAALWKREAAPIATAPVSTPASTPASTPV